MLNLRPDQIYQAIGADRVDLLSAIHRLRLAVLTKPQCGSLSPADDVQRRAFLYAMLATFSASSLRLSRVSMNRRAEARPCTASTAVPHAPAHGLPRRTRQRRGVNGKVGRTRNAPVRAADANPTHGVIPDPDPESIAHIETVARRCGARTPVLFAAPVTIETGYRAATGNGSRIKPGTTPVGLRTQC